LFWDIMDILRVVVRFIAFGFGFYFSAWIILSAVRTFALPRSADVLLTRIIFNTMRRLFNLRLRRAKTYEERDQVMALYAPLSLLVTPLVWLGGMIIGYTFMFWAIGELTFHEAFRTSGSSLLTLGFSFVDYTPALILEFSQAAIGMILVALLIGYLPTMYSAFSKRESTVSLLEVRAGSPPSPAEMLIRMYEIRGLDYFHDLAVQWETWFIELEETHTSLAALVFFRSPKPNNSWITAAGTMLDSAGLMQSTIDRPVDPQISLMIRAGFIALRSIADSFGVEYDPAPRPDDPISISQDEFDQVYDQLVEAGLPVVADREQAWRGFAGWRVNYDVVLLALAGITMAPYAQWVSDRSVPHLVTEGKLSGGLLKRIKPVR